MFGLICFSAGCAPGFRSSFRRLTGIGLPRSFRCHLRRKACLAGAGDPVFRCRVRQGRNQGRTGKSKTCVWRWQARFMAEGVDGLPHEKTRPPGIPKTAVAKTAEVIRLPPGRDAEKWLPVFFGSHATTRNL